MKTNTKANGKADTSENGDNARANGNDEPVDAVEKTSDNYVEGNSIYIMGGFDDTITKNVVPNLVRIIEQQRKLRDGKIEFYVNSVGGYVYALNSILTLVSIAKSHGIKIVTYNMGEAYSCGSILCVVGDERYMYRYAKNLMHLGQDFSVSSTIKNLKRNGRRSMRHFEGIIDIYKRHTKLSVDKIREIMSDDCYYLDAKECVRHGLADKILDC